MKGSNPRNCCFAPSFLFSGSGSHRATATTSLTLETSLDKEAAEAAAARDARQRENPPKILCCSAQDPEDFQVDLCPRSWFNLGESGGCLDGIWKMLFIVCCLPLCYPCYLTRCVRVPR